MELLFGMNLNKGLCLQLFRTSLNKINHVLRLLCSAIDQPPGTVTTLLAFIKYPAMPRKFTLLSLCLLLTHLLWAQSTSSLRGKVVDNGKPLSYATVALVGTPYGTSTDEEGNYLIPNVPVGTYQLRVSMVGYETIERPLEVKGGRPSEADGNPNRNRHSQGRRVIELNFTLKKSQNDLSQVEVFGEREKQPAKLESITRLPLKPSEQIQSISVISERLIEQQGALTVMEAARNVPGVYTYSTYGGVRESISSRGFRGIPTLKNGVRVMTDFRGMGFSTDMQGVESIQVLKGAAAITMGAATDLGGPGGIVNIVTKTPKFVNAGEVSLRGGSWGLIRPTFDVQGVNKAQTLAFRLDGAYENGGKFRDHMDNESFYINPSLTWRPSAKTSVTLEMDYYREKQGIDVGTVNLSVGNRENQIYDLPTNRFLGFETDKTDIKHSTYTAQFKHNLTDQLYIRAAGFYSDYDSDAIKTSLAGLRANTATGVNVDQVNMYSRSIGHNQARVDKSSVLQFDLVGEKIKTGTISHTFQAGVDYRYIDLFQPTYNSIVIDTINVFDETLSNKLPENTKAFQKTSQLSSYDYRFGATFQDVIQLTNWVRLYGGVRYSSNRSKSSDGTSTETTHFWNPLAGVMFTVKEGLNVFGSYTNSTSPESSTQLDSAGNTLGNATISQWEAGIKSEWFGDRLRFNLTLFRIHEKNLVQQLYDINNQPITVDGHTVYRQEGDDIRQGVEVELTGRVLENLEAIVGYSYIDAQYKNTLVNVEGSAPNNTPKHTFNAWANYSVNEGALRGLSFGAGVYYLGKRPYNDWTQAGYLTHGLDTSKKPWDNKAYTTTNAQIGYQFPQHWSIRVLFNNIFDTVGYDAYRTSFIDRIQPRNVSGVISYKF